MPGGESIPVTVADMADCRWAGRSAWYTLVWDGLFHLPSQARQVDCFRNVARVLAPGGAFVIECFVPVPALWQREVEVNNVAEDSASMTLTRHDPVAQRIFRQRITFADGRRVRMIPVAIRYCWPSELDLMAELAGLRLRERYADWSRTPFGPASRGHVSVYEQVPSTFGQPQRKQAHASSAGSAKLRGAVCPRARRFPSSSSSSSSSSSGSGLAGVEPVELVELVRAGAVPRLRLDSPW